jgi:hypothetical protein
MLTGYEPQRTIIIDYCKRSLTIIMAMDLYSTERDQLERHRAVIERADRMAFLMPTSGPHSLAAWLAGRLRHAADRLDPRPSLEAQRPAVIRSIRRPAP